MIQAARQTDEQMKLSDAAKNFNDLMEKLSDIPGFLDGLWGHNFDERIRNIPTKLNEFGYDEFGFNPIWARNVLYTAYVIYHYYFRTEAFGLENIPEGRCLLVANHSGQLPIDGAMIAGSLIIDGDPPRFVRSMIEKWVSTLPWVSIFMQRVGQIVGTPQNCRRLLENEEMILVFPEGVRGVNKLFHERYQLQEFGNGFMRLALESDAPVVPVAVIGGEEQAPSFLDFKPMAKLLGFPAFPITPTWPLLGPLGLLPYPVKYRLHFGEPMYFKGSPHEETEELARKVKTVKHTLQQLIRKGLEQRKHVFW